ncbi:uncharacterized protein J4E79_010151 [Alternaria viburni]|uniref:uncharacterized protein n=1 Tax=Alternaria viburni TaxID=566460 RepID=UPI0020C29611|nr:uncharacterized protein J4E79_010151 [Alternaria viburni]KAI4648529.1 hypothetical protein J4E79_010151 [Alternaria viburni]
MAASEDENIVTTATSSTKLTGRRRITKQPPLEKGKPKDPASFINVEGPEATIAAYCNIDDVGRFRKFYTSPLVMPYYLKAMEYKGHHRRTVLSLLEDLPYDQYWSSDDDAHVVYPAGDTSIRANNRNHGLGLVLWQCLRAIRKGLSAETPAIDVQQFVKLTSCKLPTTTTPLTAGEVPSLGPFTAEVDIEPLNRVLCLFSHMKHTLSPSQWEKRFFGKSDWDAPRKITSEYQPPWMRTHTEIEAEAPDESSGPPPEVPLELRIQWRADSKQKHNIAYVKELHEQETFDEIPKNVVVTVLQSMSAPEVRDRIRLAFRLHDYDGQLESVTYQDDENSFPTLETDWKKALELLTKNPKATFTCLLRQRHDGANAWEHSGPPAVLATFLQNKHGQVAPRYKLSEEQKADVRTAIFQMTVHKLETPFDPLKIFNNDLARMAKAYGGHDVTKPGGMLTWQTDMILPLVNVQPVVHVEDTKMKAFRRFSKAQQALLSAAAEDGAMQTIDMEQPEEEEYEAAKARYYAYQTAMGGTSTCVGPPIETAVRALDMVREDEEGEEAYAFKAFTTAQVKRRLRPFQVNGASWCISTLWPETTSGKSSDAIAAGSELKRLNLPGIIIADQTGNGKTILSLAVMTACLRPCAFERGSGRAIYKPIFIAAPQNLIRQWAREIKFEWPLFELVISYDDGQMEAALAEHVVSSSAVRTWKEDTTLWPENLAYMLDPFDERNSRTIVLTTPETNAERSLVKTEIEHPPVSYTKPKFDSDGNEIYFQKARIEKRYHSRWEKTFSVVIVDEATKIKSPASMRHIAIQRLKANRWVFVTATPMINKGTCILGPMAIIWETLKDRISQQNDTEETKWFREQLPDISVYNKANDLEDDDPHRLGVLNPYSAKLLLESENMPLVATCFPLIEQLMVLRRTTASRIPRDPSRKDFYSLRDLIKPHHMRTRVLARLPEEEAEFEWLHRDAAQRYLEAKSSADKTTEEDPGSSLVDEKLVFGTAEMRELVIITGSTQAAKFNLICGDLDSDTLVKTLDAHRLRGWTAFDVTKFMCKASNQRVPTTVAGYAAFMMDGSPMLRGLVHEVVTHVRDGRPGKILVTEDSPLLAWWWDLTLNLIGVKTLTFHSALSAADRDNLIDRFNSPKDDLQVMVLPYRVGALGINLQRDCSDVKVMSCAENQGTETQATMRPIRMNSPREVTITKMFVQNSLCAYRESKKSDKYIVELATRAQDPEIRALAVQVLNEYHLEVRAAQDDPENQDLLQMLLHERTVREQQRRDEKEAQSGAQAVADHNRDVDAENIIQPGTKRERKRPERFEDLKWSEGGARVGTMTEAEREAQEAMLAELDLDENDFPSSSRSGRDDWVHDLDLADVATDSVFQVSDDEEDEDTGTWRPITEKQRARLEAKAARQARPEMTEAVRQLAEKLLDDYDRVYGEDDLKKDYLLTRALRLIHSKKTGLPFDSVQTVHIKYTRFNDDIAPPIDIKKAARPMLVHLLSGGREQDFKEEKKKGKKKRQSEGQTQPASSKRVASGGK